MAFKYAIVKGGKILKFKKDLKGAREEFKQLKNKATFPAQYQIYKLIE